MKTVQRTFLTLAASMPFCGGVAMAQDGFVPERVLLRGDAEAQGFAQLELAKAGFPVTFVRQYDAFDVWLYRFDDIIRPDEVEELTDVVTALVADTGISNGDFDLPASIERGGGQTGSLWVSGVSFPQFENQYGIGVIGGETAASHATGLGVKIAIIDSGLTPNAPVSLDYALPYGYDFVGGTGKLAGVPIDSGDGFDNNGLNGNDEGVGHGTFVASLISRVAPSARHLHIKVLDDEGECFLSDVIGALEVCIAEHAHVVNISLTPSAPTGTLSYAISVVRENGAIIVASAGNNGLSVNPFAGSEPSLIQVGATMPDDSVWANSSVGPWVDIFAPGVSVLDAQGQPVNGQTVIGPIGRNAQGQPKFVAASGTSFSAAFVSGAAACYRAANGGWPNASVPAADIATRFRADLYEAGEKVFDSGERRMNAATLVASLPPVPRCPGDIVPEYSGGSYQFTIDGGDLAALLARWGTDLSDPRRIDTANLVDDFWIDASDLGTLLAEWGSAAPPSCP